MFSCRMFVWKGLSFGGTARDQPRIDEPKGKQKEHRVTG